jgi:hypothetical protein
MTRDLQHMHMILFVRWRHRQRKSPHTWLAVEPSPGTASRPTPESPDTRSGFPVCCCHTHQLRSATTAIQAQLHVLYSTWKTSETHQLCQAVVVPDRCSMSLHLSGAGPLPDITGGACAGISATCCRCCRAALGLGVGGGVAWAATSLPLLHEALSTGAGQGVTCRKGAATSVTRKIRLLGTQIRTHAAVMMIAANHT